MESFEQKRRKLHQQFAKELNEPLKQSGTPDHRQNIMVHKPDCPYSHKNTGWISESRYIWWLNHPEDPILKDEIIHHINMNRKDNRIENLIKIKGNIHTNLHREIRRLKMFKKIKENYENEDIMKTMEFRNVVLKKVGSSKDLAASAEEINKQMKGVD